MTQQTAPSADGSNRLFRDSRFGLIMSYVTGVALTFGAAELAKVDLSNHKGWWVPFAALGVSHLAGALTAYKAKRDAARASRGY